MGEYQKAVKLDKPDELKKYLSGMNLIVLTTEVPIGDIVEYGLDWVVDLFKEVDEAVSDGFTDHEHKFETVFSITEVLTTVVNHLQTRMRELDALTLGDYYDLKFTHDKEIIDMLFSKLSPMRTDISLLQDYQDLIRDDVEVLKMVSQTLSDNENIFTFIGDLMINPRIWFRDRVEDIIYVVIDTAENIFERYW